MAPQPGAEKFREDIGLRICEQSRISGMMSQPYLIDEPQILS